MHGLETIIRLNNEATAKQEQLNRVADTLHIISNKEKIGLGDRIALKNIATFLEKGPL
jgi:hypothetical protein